MRNYNYDSWLTSFLDYDDYEEEEEEDLPETNKQEN